MLPEIEVPQVEDIQAQGGALVSSANALVIHTQAEQNEAGAQLVRIARYRKTVAERLGPAKKAADAAHKAITKLERDLLAPATEAEKRIKAAVLTYDIEQTRIRMEEQARLAAVMQKEQEDAALAEAQSRSDAGDKEGAEQILDAVLVMPPPVIELPVQKVDGISTRKSWDFRIVNPEKINPAFTVPDEKKIRALVKALGPDAANAIGPGVEIFEQRIVAVRA